MSLAPRLAPVGDLPSVVAITALNFNLSRLTGPAIGGLLIQTAGAPAALALTAVTYGAPAAAIYFMRPRERSGATGHRTGGYFGALADGWRYVFKKRSVRAAIVFTGLGALAGRSVLETLPILANGVFGQGPSGLGYMTAAAGAGAAGASLYKVLSKPQKPDAFPRHILALPVCIPLLVAGLTVITGFHAAVAAIAVLGGTVTLLAISLQSLVQMAIEDNYRGRVMGLWTTISIGSGALGAMTMGLLIDWLGVSLAQLSIGATLAFIGSIAVSRFRNRTGIRSGSWCALSARAQKRRQ